MEVLTHPRDSLHVARTLQALELVADAPRSAPELARSLAIHTRTARRLLRRLAVEGYVAAIGSSPRRYVPSSRLHTLSSSILRRADLANRAQPFLGRLREDTGYGAHLFVPSELSVLCIAEDAAGEGWGDTRPYHASAAGKALLAHRSERAELLPEALERYTEHTLVDRLELSRELLRVYRSGYAVDDREHHSGVRAVAAPAFTRGGAAVAAVEVRGDASTFTGERFEVAREGVVEVATCLSVALGDSQRLPEPD